MRQKVAFGCSLVRNSPCYNAMNAPCPLPGSRYCPLDAATLEHPDLTGEQWECSPSLSRDLSRRQDGRRRPWRGRRAVLNGILYVLVDAGQFPTPSGPQQNIRSFLNRGAKSEHRSGPIQGSSAILMQVVAKTM